MEAKVKKIIRRNLAINDIYTIVDSFNTGGLENACLCDNCNRPIVNVAVIKNSKDVIFSVGLDCASTLNNLQGFYFLELEFNELKSLLSKMNKAKKEGNELKFNISKNGGLCCWYDYNDKHLGFNREIVLFYKDLEFSQKYLKSFLNEVENPEKIGFSYTEVKDIEKIDFFKKSENLDFKKEYNINGFNFIFTVAPYFHMVTKEISGYDLHLNGFKDGLSIYDKRLTSFRIDDAVNIAMRNYYFENYNNKN